MTLIYFLIVIGILVFVHEFGHFIMAKRAGVRVEKFSLGMGPKLFGFKKGDTEYVLSALPLGGYVKMAGENPDEEPTGASGRVPVQDRVAARQDRGNGPAHESLCLPSSSCRWCSWSGPIRWEPAKVGYVEKGSPAEQAGFLVGDVIEKINGRSIGDWDKAEMLFAVNPDTDMTVVIERSGEKKTLSLRPKLDAESEDRRLGPVPGFSRRDRQADSRGFPRRRRGSRSTTRSSPLTATTVYYWNQFSSLIKKSKGKKLTLTLERAGKRIEKIAVTPIEKDGKYVIGVEPLMQLVFKKYGFLESLRLGFDKTIESIDLTFITLKKLLTLNLSIKTLGGPVMIAQMSGQAAAAGLSSFLSLLAMISISLGILNLLPIPVLDGGLILFLVSRRSARSRSARK